MNKRTFRILPKIICRTPAFPLNSELETEWTSLKNLIADSSPGFHRLICDVDFEEIQNQPFKVQFTIWKYWNRSRFRATPFAEFASLTLLPATYVSHGKAITISRTPIPQTFASWRTDINLNPEEIFRKAEFYRVNSSYYKVGSEIRYFVKNEEDFELTSVKFQDTLVEILEFCSVKRSRGELYRCLINQLQLSEYDIDDLLRQLIEKQLLLTDLHRNVVGEDYFTRIGSSVNTRIGSFVDKDTLTYSMSERRLIAGEFPSNRIESVKELVSLLSSVKPLVENENLNNFKRNFSRRFEHRLEVPLLEALDPEIGVGYLALDNLPNEQDLINNILSSTKYQSDSTQVKYSALHRYFSNRLGEKETIRLENMKRDFSQLHSSRLPNTFSVHVQVAGDSIVVKQIGGSTATGLIGRFTLINEEFESFGKEIAEVEEAANPDVVIFDIGYQAEKNVDDVNRRKQLYKFELPILSWSESEYTLDLNDIWVSVVKDQILLTSKKLKKRIVPRLATAYNYNRSTSSVFRFLADLQHQGLQTNLTLELDKILPYSKYYPRVMYKEIVVSPAKWLVPSELYKKAPSAAQNKILKGWLKENNITSPFFCGDNDQKLCFDPGNSKDMACFLNFISNKAGLYIEESFSSGKSLVTDEMTKGYLAEFILSFGHDSTVYDPCPKFNSDDSIIKSKKTNAHFLPGSEWLYAKIYCHPIRCEELLLKVIKKIVHRNRRKIGKWFYVIYQEPDYHIRIRLELKYRNDFSFILSALQIELKPYVENSTVKDVKLESYKREIERYGQFGIHKIERLFCADSEVALNILKNNLTPVKRYSISINLLISMMDGIGLSLQEQENFVNSVATSFRLEYKVSRSAFKELNRSFKLFYDEYIEGSILRSCNGIISKLIHKNIRVLLEAKEQCRTKLLADLFHMHINRLYIENQRVYELIVYNYTLKILRMKLFND